MPETGTVHLGVARLELHLPGAASLKDKRAVLQRLTARLRDDLGCSVAEVGAQDLWRRSVLGVGVVASTHTGVVRVLDRLTAVAERDPRVQVIGVHDLVETLAADGPGLPRLTDLPGTEPAGDAPFDEPGAERPHHPGS